MASTPLEFRYTEGLASDMTAILTEADDTDVSASLGAISENTNGKGRYQVNYSGATTGHHILSIQVNGTAVATYDYILKDNTATHYPQSFSDLESIDQDQDAATNLKQTSLAVETFTVQTAEAAANTATAFDTDLATEADNYYGSGDGGLVVAFVGGTDNQFQTRRIVASSTGTANTRITLEEALDAIPSDGDAAIVLGRISELT